MWDNGNSTLVVGSADGGDATGNVLTVGTGGVVTNISQLTITADQHAESGGRVR